MTQATRAREREHLGAILILSLAALCALGGVLLSVHFRCEKVQTRIRTALHELERYRWRPDARDLAGRLADEKWRRGALLEEWSRYTSLLDMWKSDGGGAAGEEDAAGRIDFKVAHFQTCERLLDKAIRNGSKLPENLGISQDIGTGEKAYVRLLQLAAVDQLVSLALDLKVPEIRAIEALPPGRGLTDETGEVFVVEYPVRLVMRCSLATFGDLLARVPRARHFFTLAHVKAERVSVEAPDLLHVTVIFNALVIGAEQS